jgi:hypothetical protein
VEGREKECVPFPLAPQQLSLASSFTAFLVRFAGGGEGIGEQRGSEDSGGGCSGGECSGPDGLGGECSETGGAVRAGIAAAKWFATSPMVVF